MVQQSLPERTMPFNSGNPKRIALGSVAYVHTRERAGVMCAEPGLGVCKLLHCWTEVEIMDNHLKGSNNKKNKDNQVSFVNSLWSGEALREGCLCIVGYFFKARHDFIPETEEAP
uniref:Uncharacterized protein n=2 Tax=Micrurus surinamensis TaxID=129470 RepID=A0A2D4PX03_MICSU